jgi:molybdate transport system regulatory protein
MCKIWAEADQDLDRQGRVLWKGVNCGMENKVKELFKKGDFRVNGSLWIEGDGQRFFGPGPVELLELIEQTGSINKAAKAMAMSYKKAWEMVNRINGLAAAPFVVTSVGGEDGGGSTISAAAKDMIAWYRGLRERFTEFLANESKDLKQ